MTMRRLLAALVFLPALAHAQAFRVGSGVQLVPRSSEPAHAAANGTLWVDSSASNVLKYCNPAGSCITLGSGGGGSTLAAAYAAGASQTDSTLALDSTRLGIRIRDNATPIAGSLFAIQNSGGGTDYFKVAASAITLGVSTTPSADNTINLGGSGNRYSVLYALELGSGASSLTHTSGVANSGTNVAHIFNSSNTLGGTTLLASFRNNGTEKVRIDSAGILLFSASGAGTCNNAGTYCLVLNTASVGLYAPTGAGFQPEADQVNYLGNPSKRWSVAFLGDADADKPACDSTTRGGIIPVFAAGGASDTFQVCLKAAADTYAWRTVYTAP